MNYSYWEFKEWFSNNDFVVVGSGIVGLNCAIHLKEKFPKANILILEKGILPQGASTKNAGFACFGSISELLNDLKSHSEIEMLQLVEKRRKGLQLMRGMLGDHKVDYQQNYGYELFESTTIYNYYQSKIEYINKLLFPLFKQDVFNKTGNKFKFQNCAQNYIVNKLEGQIDTGKMMFELLKLAHKKGIKILNSTIVKTHTELNSKVIIETNHGIFTAKKLLFATNGFSKSLFEENIQPARAQVIITKPIQNLHIKGTFHLENGYCYFRNIDNRILLGGGRNLDFKTEETTEFGKTEIVQNKLYEILRTIVLPNTSFEIDKTWSGIMGVGSQKNPIVKQISNNVYCGIRLGGMGVAIGSLVGKELAELIDKK